MRRLARFLWTSLMLLSAVLCVATIVLWVRSTGTIDEWYCAKSGTGMFSLSSESGRLDLELVLRYPNAEACHYSYKIAGDHKYGDALTDQQRAMPALEIMALRGEGVDKRFDVCGTAYFAGRVHATVWPGHGVLWTGRFLSRRELAAGRPGRLTDLGDDILRATDPLPYQRLRIPHWTAATGFALPPLITLVGLPRRRRRLRRRRTEAGLCVECGYDLRSSPGACPECGAERLAAHPV